MHEENTELEADRKNPLKELKSTERKCFATLYSKI